MFCLITQYLFYAWFCFDTNHFPIKDKSTGAEENTQKAPEFVTPPRSLHVPDGAKATLSCTVVGDPPPSVQWQKGRQMLKHGTKYKVIIKHFIYHFISFNMTLM